MTRVRFRHFYQTDMVSKYVTRRVGISIFGQKVLVSIMNDMREKCGQNLPKDNHIIIGLKKQFSVFLRVAVLHRFYSTLLFFINLVIMSS